MPKFLIKRWHGMHHLWAFVLMLLMTITLATYDWKLGVLGLVLSGAIGFYSVMAERAFRRDLKTYLGTLSYRVKKAGHEVISDLPFGIILYNEEKTIEWHNAFITNMLERESVVGESLDDLFPTLSQAKEREGTMEASIGNAIYELMFRFDERLLYVRDITKQWQLAKRYEEEKMAIGIVMMDNLEEVTQGMDDQQRSALMSRATAEITEWASKFHVYLKRLTSDRYLVITDQRTLKQLELSRFVLLDEVREIIAENKIPMTLSIGFAAGAESIVELGHWAQTSLDYALGRGGDQAAVKVGQRQSFYGGKSNAVEKRTRVRARVVAHALRDLMRDSDRVVIMGHKMPDMDSIGAAIGVLKAAMLLARKRLSCWRASIPAIQKMMEMLREDERSPNGSSRRNRR